MIGVMRVLVQNQRNSVALLLAAELLSWQQQQGLIRCIPWYSTPEQTGSSYTHTLEQLQAISPCCNDRSTGSIL